MTTAPATIPPRTRLKGLVSCVARVVREQNLFSPGSTLLVAVSGGPDSIALLSLLRELAPSWRLTVAAIHINYGLRGEESEADAEFVADLCRRWRIELHIERIPWHAQATAARGRSLQEWARDRRYEVMRRVATRLKVDRIVLGHQADDQAETVLMRLLQGAGTRGLAGIPPSREGLIVRPLLSFTRAQILGYLHARHLVYREDSSNAKPIYARNRLRHELMPLLKRLHPSMVSTLARSADILREDLACLEQIADEHYARMVRATATGDLLLDRAAFLALPAAMQRWLLRALARQANRDTFVLPYGETARLLHDVIHGRSGSHRLVRSLRFSREYDRIRVQRISTSPASPDGPKSFMKPSAAQPVVTLVAPGTAFWPGTSQWLSLKPGGPYRHALEGRQGPLCAMFDARLAGRTFTLRTWQPGDRFAPVGMKGNEKKLQDFFGDMKMPRARRHDVPLLVGTSGILWVCGYRTDQRFIATPASTETWIAELHDHHPDKG